MESRTEDDVDSGSRSNEVRAFRPCREPGIWQLSETSQRGIEKTCLKRWRRKETDSTVNSLERVHKSSDTDQIR